MNLSYKSHQDIIKDMKHMSRRTAFTEVTTFVTKTNFGITIDTTSMKGKVV